MVAASCSRFVSRESMPRPVVSGPLRWMTGIALVLAMGILPPAGANEGDRQKRADFLNHLLKTYRSEAPGEEPKEVPIWETWLRRTGELPPDFDQMPANAFPPHLLTFQDGRSVADAGQWAARRQELRAVLDEYAFGDWPPPQGQRA